MCGDPYKRCTDLHWCIPICRCGTHPLLFSLSQQPLHQPGAAHGDDQRDAEGVEDDELAEGDTIAIPNDGSNETRALLLLQDAGLIKLKDGIDPTSDATKLDITENPKNLDIQEIAAEQLPRSLADVDLAVINGNYALQADLNAAEDSLITENPDYAKVYVNVVACRSGEENSDKIQALKKAMQSDDVKKYVDETYKGAVVTVF